MAESNTNEAYDDFIVSNKSCYSLGEVCRPRERIVMVFTPHTSMFLYFYRNIYIPMLNYIIHRPKSSLIVLDNLTMQYNCVVQYTIGQSKLNDAAIAMY